MNPKPVRQLTLDDLPCRSCGCFKMDLIHAHKPCSILSSLNGKWHMCPEHRVCWPIEESIECPYTRDIEKTRHPWAPLTESDFAFISDHPLNRTDKNLLRPESGESGDRKP